MKLDLSGRRVLVTGASSGIGAATCRSIVAYGGTVAMLARRKDRLDELEAELGPRAKGICCDVKDLSALESAVTEAANALGGLDTVITVAGRNMVGSIGTGDPQQWLDLLNLNIVGALATIRYSLPHFAKQGRRNVVLIGSATSLTPMPGVGIYAATKRGLKAAFDSLRLELAYQGIAASIVLPGMFETEGLSAEGIIFNGEVLPSDMPILTEDAMPASPSILADTISFMLNLPEGVAINEMVIRPVGNLNP